MSAPRDGIGSEARDVFSLKDKFPPVGLRFPEIMLKTVFFRRRFGPISPPGLPRFQFQGEIGHGRQAAEDHREAVLQKKSHFQIQDLKNILVCHFDFEF